MENLSSQGEYVIHISLSHDNDDTIYLPNSFWLKIDDESHVPPQTEHFTFPLSLWRAHIYTRSLTIFFCMS